VSKQSWGHEKKSKGSKILSKKKKNQYNDAQNQMKKTKRKNPSPTLGGHDRSFWKDNSKDKRS